MPIEGSNMTVGVINYSHGSFCMPIWNGVPTVCFYETQAVMKLLK